LSACAHQQSRGYSDSIRDVVNKNMNEMRSCYVEGLRNNPVIQGTLVLQWDINTKGLVEKVSVLSSTLESIEVEDCCMERLKKWTFPVKEKPEITTVKYPFNFKASN